MEEFNTPMKLEDIPQQLFVELLQHFPIVNFTQYGNPVGKKDVTRAFGYKKLLDIGLPRRVEIYHPDNKEFTVEYRGLDTFRSYKIRGEIRSTSFIVKSILSIDAVKIASR